MKFNKVKKIIIFGGGTSGWLTAAYLTNNLQFPCEVTLIESTDLGPIGVGEGTQPATSRFMHDCGIDPKTWMKPSNASFKLGVEFAGWTDEKYFVENDFIENTIIAPDLYTVDYFLGKTKQEFFDWLPAYRLAKENKSPKLAGMDTNYAQTGYRQFGAVHFAAYDIVKAIKHIIIPRITYVNTRITDIDTDDNGVVALKNENGDVFTADLYLDCSGFASILLEKKLGVDFTSVTDILPCDKAVVLQTQY
jgi:tryptophan halogenase